MCVTEFPLGAPRSQKRVLDALESQGAGLGTRLWRGGAVSHPSSWKEFILTGQALLMRSLRSKEIRFVYKCFHWTCLSLKNQRRVTPFSRNSL